MSLRRRDASDEDDISESDNDSFSDSELSFEEGEGSGVEEELVTATNGLNIYGEQKPVGKREVGAVGKEGLLQDELEEGEWVEPAQDEAGKLPESAQLEPGELLGPAQDEAGSQGERALEESQGNNAPAEGWASPRSQPSRDSEEDIGAGEEDFESSPEKPPLKDKSERRANEVPPGKFWLHDDRTEDDANNRRATGRNKLWDRDAGKEWKHDLFFVDPAEDDYRGSFAKKGAKKGRGNNGPPGYGQDPYQTSEGGRGRGHYEQNSYENGRRYQNSRMDWYDSSDRDNEYSRPGKSHARNAHLRNEDERGYTADRPLKSGSSTALMPAPPPGYEHRRQPQARPNPKTNHSDEPRQSVDRPQRAQPDMRREESSTARPVGQAQRSRDYSKSNGHTESRPAERSGTAEETWPSLSSRSKTQKAQNPTWVQPTAQVESATAVRDDGWGVPASVDNLEEGWGSPPKSSSEWPAENDGGWGSPTQPSAATNPVQGGKSGKTPATQEKPSWTENAKATPDYPAQSSTWGDADQFQGSNAVRAGISEPSSRLNGDDWGSGGPGGWPSVQQPTSNPLPEHSGIQLSSEQRDGPKLTPWGAPIPEPAEDIAWGEKVTASGEWGSPQEISTLPSNQHFQQQEKQPGARFRAWNVDAQDFKAPLSQNPASLNIQAPQFIPPVMPAAAYNPQHATAYTSQPAPAYDSQRAVAYDSQPGLSYSHQVLLPNGISMEASNLQWDSQGASQAALASMYYSGEVPGPMQTFQHSGVLQRPRPARRPITIEAPPDFTGSMNPAGGSINPTEATGGRRYSAMSQYPH